jgi:hypothetical protein
VKENLRIMHSDELIVYSINSGTEKQLEFKIDFLEIK